MNIVASSVVRLASTLPTGSLTRQVMLFHLRDAASPSGSNKAGRDNYARSQFLAGLSGDAPARVEAAMKRGGESIARYEALLAERGGLDDPDSRARLDGGLTAGLMQIPMWGWDAGFFTAVSRGASAVMGKAVDEASKYQPALKGVTGEDLASVQSYGGLQWPGDRFDDRVSAFPDVPKSDPRSKIRGRYVPRDPDDFAYPLGESIYYAVGEQARKQSKISLTWILSTLYRTSRNNTRDWARSVDAGRYLPFPQDVEGTEFVPVPGYEGDGSFSLDYLAREFYLAAIGKRMDRALASNPTQAWLWSSIMRGLDDRKNFVRTTGDGGLSVRQKPLVDWLRTSDAPMIEIPNLDDYIPEDSELEAADLDLEGKSWSEVKQILERSLGLSSAQAQKILNRAVSPSRISRAFAKMVPKMQRAFNDLSDAEIYRGLPKDMRDMYADPEIRSVWLSEVRRRKKSASARRVAKDWIQKAVKKPGRLHKHFGIPEDEDIPVAKIKGEITKLKKKAERSTEETSLLRALNMALTLKDMSKKKAGIMGKRKARVDDKALGKAVLDAVGLARTSDLLRGNDLNRYFYTLEAIGNNLLKKGIRRLPSGQRWTDAEAREMLFENRELAAQIQRDLSMIRGYDVRQLADILTVLADLQEKMDR